MSLEKVFKIKTKHNLEDVLDVIIPALDISIKNNFPYDKVLDYLDNNNYLFKIYKR